MNFSKKTRISLPSNVFVSVTFIAEKAMNEQKNWIQCLKFRYSILFGSKIMKLSYNKYSFSEEKMTLENCFICDDDGSPE